MRHMYGKKKGKKVMTVELEEREGRRYARAKVKRIR